MALLLQEVVSFRSPLPPEEVLSRLDGATSPARWRNPFSRQHRPFEGEVNPSGFAIARIIHYRNSFVPRVEGRVKAESGGSTIELTFRLKTFNGLFVALWFSAAAVAAIGIGAYQLTRGQAPLLAGAPLAAMALMALVMRAAFRFEAARATALIQALAAPGYSYQ
jgi:hypothetical protein